MMNISKNNEAKFLKTIQNTLKVKEAFAIELLSGGLSGSEVVKVITLDKIYVIRLWNMQWVDYFSQDLDCQLIASDAGYGPKVHFFDKEEGITVMDYHFPEPLPEVQIRLKALVNLLKKIHTGPVIPKGLDRTDYIDLLLEENKNTKLFDIEVLRTIKNKVFSNTRSKASCVPCHRDLHHGNLLFTKGRFLAIDYTWGAMDDPYADLANVAVFNCETSQEEKVLLKLYLGRDPNTAEIARFSLMKLPAKLFYGLEFLGIASANNINDLLIPHSTSYKNFGIQIDAAPTLNDLLGYGTSLLTEVINYSNTKQYAKDLEEVSRKI